MIPFDELSQEGCLFTVDKQPIIYRTLGVVGARTISQTERYHIVRVLNLITGLVEEFDILQPGSVLGIDRYVNPSEEEEEGGYDDGWAQRQVGRT